MSKSLHSKLNWIYKKTAQLILSDMKTTHQQVCVLLAPDSFSLKESSALHIALTVKAQHVDGIAKAWHLPFESHSVDHLILAFSPIDRVHTRLFIEEAKIALKPGGRLTFLSFNPYRYDGRAVARYVQAKTHESCSLISFFEMKDLLFESELRVLEQQFFCFNPRFPVLDRFLQFCFPLWGYAYCIEAIKVTEMNLSAAYFDLSFPQAQNTPI